MRDGGHTYMQGAWITKKNRFPSRFSLLDLWLHRRLDAIHNNSYYSYDERALKAI
jgi:hypothetical protein